MAEFPPEDFARRFDKFRPVLGPQGLLEVDLGVLGDGVGGGEIEDVSEVPSSDDLLPRSPIYRGPGEGDSFLLEEPFIGL